MDNKLLNRCIRHLPIDRGNAEYISLKCAEECIDLYPDISKADFDLKGEWIAKRLSIYPETIALFLKAWGKSKP